MRLRRRLRPASRERVVAAALIDFAIALAVYDGWKRVRGEEPLLAFGHGHDDEDEHAGHDDDGHAHDHDHDAPHGHAHVEGGPMSKPVWPRLRRDATWAAIGTANDALLQGATPGRHLMGVRVARRDGTPIDLRTAAVRNVAPRVISRLVWLTSRTSNDDRIVVGTGCALGLTLSIAQVLDPELRSLGDRLAGTRAFRA